ncbi:hypothetical protein [Halomonas alkalicola]|uniref:hypothetical protein n=1 Tax=Halomonas alkalicola TaxID=1930622 RepID=UPI00265E9252|nr:hypothetical protein [Halomonas alkalicola]
MSVTLNTLLSHPHGLPPPLPANSATPAKPLPSLQEITPASSPEGRHEPSDWAKLIIIWSLLQSMNHDPKLEGAKPLAPPDGAGLVYGPKGRVEFGPTPAGQALTGTAQDVTAPGMSHLGIGSGALPTTGVGGGMAGAFVSVAV